MNYTTFKNILAKSKRKLAILSGVLTIAGTIMLFATIAGDKGTAGYIISGILLLFFFAMVISVKDLMAIQLGEYPLLKAIREKQTGYVIWIYNKEISAQVEGIRAGTANNVVICTKNNKMQEIVLGKKTAPSEVIHYLHSEFPDAHVGYADDTREAVSKLLGKKV